MFWWECSGLGVQETASQYLWENCSKKAGGESGYIQVCNKGRRQSEQRSSTKLRNLAFYVWEDGSFWAHWINSLHLHLSYLGPNLFPFSPCFVHSPSSPAVTLGSGCIHLIAVLGALIYIWRPEIADGCDLSCLWQEIWQEIFSFHSLNICFIELKQLTVIFLETTLCTDIFLISWDSYLFT